MDLTFVILFNPNSLVMRTQSTFSVLFWVYAKRAKNNLATVYARITINGRKLNISLQRKLDVSLWDPKKQWVKGTSSKSKSINQFLDQEYSQFFQCYQELKVEGKILSPENLKARYNGYNGHLYTLEDIFKYNSKRFKDFVLFR